MSVVLAVGSMIGGLLMLLVGVYLFASGMQEAQSAAINRGLLEPTLTVIVGVLLGVAGTALIVLTVAG